MNKRTLLQLFQIKIFISVAPIITPFPMSEKPTHMDQYISLSCVVSDGDLPLYIQWKFNGQPITLTHDVSIAKLGKRNSVLTIESVTARHAGKYMCVAENQAGNTNFSTELKVIGALNLDYDRISI